MSIPMKTFTLSVIAVALLGATAVHAQDQGKDQAQRQLTSITAIKGVCDKMIRNGAELAPCKPTLASFTYSDGRQSFIFFNGSLTSQDTQLAVAFSGNIGREVKQADGSIMRPIDLIVAGSTPETMTTLDATGSCLFTDPLAGKSVIICTADTAEGKFSGQFTTSGETPEVTKLQ